MELIFEPCVGLLELLGGCLEQECRVSEEPQLKAGTEYLEALHHEVMGRLRRSMLRLEVERGSM